MLNLNASPLSASEILELLREFHAEAENVISHLAEIDCACRKEIAQFAHE